MVWVPTWDCSLSARESTGQAPNRRFHMVTTRVSDAVQPARTDAKSKKGLLLN
jgi:hypothetical protein